jgi:beta-phosphoglucomutase
MKDYSFIFDMDGVIVDSNPYHKISLRQFCEKHGRTLTDQELRERIYGRTNKEWIKNVFGELPPPQIAAYAEEKEALYRMIYEKDIRPVKGLISFLQRLEQLRISPAIGTSAPRANVDFTLDKTETRRFFNTILDESYVTIGKPNPEIYLKVARALNRAPGECIVFEDSLAGIEAGKAAGCKVVGITTTHSREELWQTDFIIDDFEGLDPLELQRRV